MRRAGIGPFLIAVVVGMTMTATACKRRAAPPAEASEPPPPATSVPAGPATVPPVGGFAQAGGGGPVAPSSPSKKEAARPKSKPPRSTRVVVDGPAGDDGKPTHLTVTGPAFARFDATQGAFSIHVYSPDVVPTPSCNIEATGAGMKKGSSVSIGIRGFEQRAGMYNYDSYFIMQAQAGGGSMKSDSVAGASAEIVTYDAKSFSAVLWSDSSGTKITGMIVGKVCPP